MVLHYFESRDQLFDEVVRRVGRRILAQVEEAVVRQDDPEAALARGLDRLWDEVLKDPALRPSSSACSPRPWRIRPIARLSPPLARSTAS